MDYTSEYGVEAEDVLICDDCSYSGNYIFNVVNYINEGIKEYNLKHNNKISLHYHVVIPYMIEYAKSGLTLLSDFEKIKITHYDCQKIKENFNRYIFNTLNRSARTDVGEDVLSFFESNQL